MGPSFIVSPIPEKSGLVFLKTKEKVHSLVSVAPTKGAKKVMVTGGTPGGEKNPIHVKTETKKTLKQVASYIESDRLQSGEDPVGVEAGQAFLRP